MTHRRPAAPADRPAFTVIELLVVIALIAVLSGLLIMGVGKMSTSAKRQQTIALLHNCQSLFAEFASVTHPKYPTTIATPCPWSVQPDYLNTVDGRFGFTVQLTQSLFAQMRTVPNVRASMDKIPPQQLMTNTHSSSYPRNNWTPGAIYDPDSPTDSARFATVDAANGYAVFLVTQPHVASDGAVTYQSGQPNPTGLSVGDTIQANRPPDTSYWFPFSSDATTRVVTDAWGNPIIACFGGALGNNVSPPVTLPTVSPHVPDSNLYLSGRSAQVTSPDHRLFFASAGPDGNFSLGDDNLYSFEQ